MNRISPCFKINGFFDTALLILNLPSKKKFEMLYSTGHIPRNYEINVLSSIAALEQVLKLVLVNIVLFVSCIAE